jgi:hypothetical protein
MKPHMLESGKDENDAVWSRLSLGDALTADSQLAELEEQFARVYEQAGRPAAMGLFKRYDTEHSLHCTVTVYFSPAARSIARASGAVACPAPARANLELMAGDRACLTRLFAAADADTRNPAGDRRV